MAAVVYYLGKLDEDGTLNMKNAIGKIGTVYLKIPRERSGMGQVQVNIQGFRTLDAITDEPEDLATGKVIEIVDIINNETLLVKTNARP
ncbi:MAG: hypothetical protein HC896_08890 [Bacteroidales bacterium]|nr:hypothetical protein [Bacteroidales bacterium]